MRTETINFRDFMEGNVPVRPRKVSKKVVITTCLIAGTLCLGIVDPAFASTGLDLKAKELYYGKFLGLAKWIIVGKGGWDTINKALKEDFDGAKKCFLQYLMVFGILLALPYGLDQVELFFRDEG